VTLVEVGVSDEPDAPEFADWVIARRGSLLRTAWLLTGDVGRAEDLVQTALLKCWPKWRRISRMADIDGYVRAVMTTTYLSWWRRRWRGEVPTERLPEPTAATVDPGHRDSLVRALARLPRGQRTAVVLRFAEDLSEAQTAEVMGCSVGTVKSQTSRALTALRADPAVQQLGGPA
jgi:RNA polymerase sigma-70 factor (sigma-E family)